MQLDTITGRVRTVRQVVAFTGAQPWERTAAQFGFGTEEYRLVPGLQIMRQARVSVMDRPINSVAGDQQLGASVAIDPAIRAMVGTVGMVGLRAEWAYRVTYRCGVCFWPGDLRADATSLLAYAEITDIGEVTRSTWSLALPQRNQQPLRPDPRPVFASMF